MRKLKYGCWLICLCLCWMYGWAQTGSVLQHIPPRPEPPRLVNDLAGMLSPSQQQTLEQELDTYSDTTSTQIAVVIVPTVGDYGMMEYALAILRQWGVGTKEHNNGVVLLIAAHDHKAFIATGYGMEGVLPDATCKEIIDQQLIPHFRQGQYFEGIQATIQAIMQAAAGEYHAQPGQDTQGQPIGNVIGLIILVLIVLFIIARIRGGGGGGGGMISRGGYWIGPFIGGGWGGGGFGGSGGFGGGGGFGGFGGGSGGGGGAGGSW
ncbi:TPM domain-containing protein [Thermoflavifilum sp.]|uniref:TPM domain-containing protein n=1 Tax=Thermoflavifilum sp. TaxID=1968839 RepID=UPI0025F781BC|nr:TPM domain-containing protein [Thermoflavifilum sp.]